MLVSASRGGRWPLALTLAILGACAEESTAPTVRGALTPHAVIDNVITVTTASGGKEVGSLRWAVASAAGGEIIRFDPSLAGATINIDSTIPSRKPSRSKAQQTAASRSTVAERGSFFRSRIS
jgi:hypothetical protein